jgi:2-C-methyl-D-erythritol 4-phosphate cytidylyltransferase
MKKSVIIVAGGSGTRMGGKRPKQFTLLANQPILMLSILCFIRYDSAIRIIVVLPESQITYWKELCIKYSFVYPHIVVVGGETRYQSVKNGLNALAESDLVAVHDGVRPLVSQKTIENCFNQAAKTGAVIPVLPVDETLRTGTMAYSQTVDRSFFFTVQTPQVFRTSLLKKAYAQNWNDTFTDDASVVEKQGIPIMMVPGNRENIKITHPGDLLLAKEYLKKNDPF